jgi:NAD(P)-dependent dehydrogenase (short-subunit alcohol dehydrogenase family)
MNLSLFSLENKTILVAGLANETGELIVKTLVDLGAQIIGIDTPHVCSIKQGLSYSHVDILPIDFYDLDNLYDNVKQLVQKTGKFNGMVFNGGIGGVRPLSLTTPDFVKSMLDANVLPFIELVRVLNKVGGLAQASSIVAISSVSSIKGLKGKIAYSASKAALEGAIRSIAAELSIKKIRVNSVIKGWVESDMSLDFIKNNRQLNDDEDLKKQLLGPSSSQEIANLVAFLLSDAVKTLTGTGIILDGGYTL